MARVKMTRPYRPGVWLRFVVPVVGVLWVGFGLVLTPTALWMFVRSDGESEAAGVAVQAVLVGLWCLVFGALAARQWLVGIWVDDRRVLVRSMFRTVTIPRDEVVDVTAAACGALVVGRSTLAPSVNRRSGDPVAVRGLATASPLRWGGSSVTEICDLVGQRL